MKLYLISQSINNGYDTYDSAVVAAKNEQAARETFPSENVREQWDSKAEKWYILRADGTRYYETYDNAWTHPKNVTVEYLGNTKHEVGVICASFNAG